MTIHGIAHYSFRVEARLMDELRDFYVDVVGLTSGPRPPFAFAGHWLYAGNRDVLHLAEQQKDNPRRAGCDLTFDHVALEATDWPAQQAMLEQHNVPYRQSVVPGTGSRQVFFSDPAQNGVELIFRQD
ncbi:MAG: diguanylate cyclase [Pseudomonadota bacterium]|nr:diguanylate cyclase [Pseudomonadota bacterium]